MKKFFYALAIVLALIFVSLYVILFTGFGNKIIANYTEDKIRTLSSLDAKFTQFQLRFSSLDIILDIANMAQVKLEGNLSLFSLGFDLNYDLSLDKNYAQKMNLKLEENLNFDGTIKGKISDFNIDGKGALFGSNVDLKARILDYNPLEVKLLANGIKIEELLKLLSKPQYLKGSININADISAKDLKADGNAFINLATNSINYDLIQRDFNLTLPSSHINANINAFLKDKELIFNSEVLSSYMAFKTGQSHYSLDSGILDTDYHFIIPDLSRLEKLTKTKLGGAVNLDGNATLLGTNLNQAHAKLIVKNLKISDKLEPSDVFSDISARGEKDLINYEINLNSKLINIPELKGYYALNSAELLSDVKVLVEDISRFKNLAGVDIQGKAEAIIHAQTKANEINNLKVDADIAGAKIELNSDGKKSNLFIKDLDLTKALALAAQPAYASGILNAKILLDGFDFTKLNGKIEANANGILGQKALSSMLNKNFPANAKYDFKIDADIKNSIIAFNLNFKSDLANLNDFKGDFDLNKMLLNSNFNLDAYDFSKLGFLLERKLSGKAFFTGNLAFDKSINASISSKDLFGANFNANLNNNDFKATLNGVDFPILMKSLDLPDYYEAKANVDMNYNLLSSTGNVNANLLNAKLKNVGIIKTITTLTKSDVTKDSFENAVLKLKLNPKQMQLDLDMKSPRVNIAINKGIIDSQNSNLNLPLSLNVDKANFKGTIKGTTQNPSITIDAGSVLKSAAEKFLKDQGSGEVQKGLNKLLDKLF